MAVSSATPVHCAGHSLAAHFPRHMKIRCERQTVSVWTDWATHLRGPLLLISNELARAETGPLLPLVRITLSR